MNSQAQEFEIHWSGAAERDGRVPGLSSPLIGSTARLGMQAGEHGHRRCGDVNGRPGKCRGCGAREVRTVVGGRVHSNLSRGSRRCQACLALDYSRTK